MLSKQIQSLRQRKGWSQTELARRLNISASAVGMYEQGRREPSISMLLALSKEFGVTIDYLVTGHICSITDSQIRKQAEEILETISGLNKLSREDLLVLLLTKMMGS